MKRRIDIFLVGIVLIGSGWTTPARAVSVAAEIFVSVPDQELVLLDRNKVIVRYPISTSKFGLGDGNGTYRTPLGTMFVSAKFGDELRSGAVIKSRVATGEIVTPDAPGRDTIVTRVIWLRGKEQQNRGARDRCIYIHGTPEERRIGRPASFGCIRMRSKDVIALYRYTQIGMHVTVTQKRTSDLLPPEEPSLLARAD